MVLKNYFVVSQWLITSNSAVELVLTFLAQVHKLWMVLSRFSIRECVLHGTLNVWVRNSVHLRNSARAFLNANQCVYLLIICVLDDLNFVAGLMPWFNVTRHWNHLFSKIYPKILFQGINCTFPTRHNG